MLINIIFYYYNHDYNISKRNIIIFQKEYKNVKVFGKYGKVNLNLSYVCFYVFYIFISFRIHVESIIRDVLTVNIVFDI